ncbi:hypothetical protein DFH11DRAFT_284927 [Phellopilus nigrolimitatus]|nr:hypothetical protein DFH11DRAFT_284927 [Phellopilus nigrolimitatus]
MSILTRPLQIHLALPLRCARISFRRRYLSVSLAPQDVLSQISDSTSVSTYGPVQQVPSCSVGSKFLEERNDEYGFSGKLINKGPLPALGGSKISSGGNAAELLARMIEKGDYGRAQVSKDEFDRAGVKVRPHKAFVAASMNALSIVDPQTRMKNFVGWWSLVPIKKCPHRLGEVFRFILQHPFDLPLLMDFCIIVARAGFVNALADHSVPRLLVHIFRYGHPDATTAFLLKLEIEAKSRCSAAHRDAWKALRGIAIKTHISAGRHRIAAEIYDCGAKDVNVSSEIHETMRHIRPSAAESGPFVAVPPASLRRYGIQSRYAEGPTPAELASELRVLRRAILSGPRPPNFESYLADFMHAYEALGRHSRAIHMLRRKAFTRGSVAVRERWVAGEQLFFSSMGRPLAVLRAFQRFCLADHILRKEVERVLGDWLPKNRTYEKRRVDWAYAREYIPVGWKVWPSSTSLKLAWKAVLQLSGRSDLERLYTLLLSHVESSQRAPTQLAETLRDLPTSRALQVIDEHYYSNKSHEVSTPPVVFPDAGFFHPFVVAMSTRVAPRRGMEVIADMQRLGIKPSVDSWGAVAGAYARSGDVYRAMRVLDHVDAAAVDNRAHLQALVHSQSHATDADVGKDDSSESRDEVQLARGQQRELERSSRVTLAYYNSVIRGFTECGMYPAARAVQQRGTALGIYHYSNHRTHGDDNENKKALDKRTRAVFHRLSRYEKGKFDFMLKKRHSVVVDGKPVYVDKSRADWLREDKKLGNMA